MFSIVKIYKSKDKLILYLPFDVVKGLKLSENDEVDFFRINESTFAFAKKADVASLLLSREAKQTQPQKREVRAPTTAPEPKSPPSSLSAEELGVLRKLDTLRYDARDQVGVNKILSEREEEVLRQLVSKKVVGLFMNPKTGKNSYSISKYIYDRFLMRKKQPAQEQRQAQATEQKPVYNTRILNLKSNVPENENIKRLEKDGFVVMQTEGEASSLSLALEESIRKGFVLGTRAFNKKFYVILRQFFDMYSTPIIKSLRENGEQRVGSIAKEVGMDEEGARAILYLLSESGDVSEKKRDLFTLA